MVILMYTKVAMGLIFLFLSVMSVSFAADQKATYREKIRTVRREKMSNHLEKEKKFLDQHFWVRKNSLEKKYLLRLSRLEKRTRKLSPSRYGKNKKRIEKWHERELKQLAFDEHVIEKKIARREHILQDLNVTP